MILQCKSCDARFLVPDSSIGPDGRRVKCGRCGHMWQARLSLATKLKAQVPDIDALLRNTPIENYAHQPARPNVMAPGSNLPVPVESEPTLLLAVFNCVLWFSAAIALVLLFAPGLIGYPSTKGLALAEVKMEKMAEVKDERFKNKNPRYALKGEIINTTDKAMAVPKLRVRLLDVEKKRLRIWQFQPLNKTIAPHQKLVFNAEKLEVASDKAGYFTIELGNPLELALRGN